MPVTAAPVSSIDRRLGGAVFADGAATQSVPLSPLTASGSPPPGTDTPIPVGPQPIAAPPDVAAGLPGLMRPDRRNAVEASVLPTRRLLLPKGAFIDCTLETAIDSTLPGLTTCIVATDTFGADGSVVLLERGTKLLGETRGQVQQGASRVFVIWTEARTPDGVVVPLDSPATDELGRSGLPGSVQRHFWQRFGAAIMISTLDGALQAAVQSSARGGALIYNPAPSADIMNDVLKGSIAIAPTVIKRNGDRIQVLVARDVDFRGVYELRHANAAH
jgi:type IV secretion system protein VirB10